MLESFLETQWPIKEKFWLHRVDCLEKLREKGSKYSGVEFDLTWHKGAQTFDVSHELQEKVRFPLEAFLKELPKGTKLWLDCKNLETSNAEEALSTLNSLLEANGVAPRDVLVESPNVNALLTFHEAGYYTSFYVPVDPYLLSSSIGNEIFAQELRQAVASGAVDAVSFPGEYYDLVKALDLKVDMLTWFGGKVWLEFYWRKNLREIMDDTAVKVILIYDQASAFR